MKHSTLKDAKQAALFGAQLFDFLGGALAHPELRDCKLITLTSVLHEAVEELEVMDKEGELYDSYVHSST
tara:strand:- start:974 stop:1183 length:210 start_codon:yes stop_codon:yes gene_type:complete